MNKNQSPAPSSRNPRIGIPIPRDYFQREPLWGNAGGYRAVNEISQAVRESGGEPVLLFPGDNTDDVNAVILPGGGDVDPSLYGQEPHRNVVETNLELDNFQISLARKALEKSLPILAICRGMQVMNVAAGGTLIQHLETHQEHFPNEARQNPDLRSLPVHTIELEPASKLAQILGQSSVSVNSLHHQAADQVPSTLRVVAKSQDGVVEAIEGTGSFQVGVQFHPEDLRHTDPRFQELFKELVAAAV